MSDSRDSLLVEIEALHAEVDRRAASLVARHGNRLQCRRGCSGCCLDDLTVSGIEAERIRADFPELLAAGAPHPRGACAFLDAEGSCRIYAARPSVCRSQGLPLRILLEDERDEIVERRDICPLNREGGPPLEELPEEDLWLIGPIELRVTELDRRLDPASRDDSKEHVRDREPSHDRDEPQRVALRSLFAKDD